MNFVVNKILNVAICLSCHIPIFPPSKIIDHVRVHTPELYIPKEGVDLLIQRFSLGNEPSYSSVPIEPVFGIPLLSKPHLFCDVCHHGFHQLSGIQTHQASERCDGISYHLGYAQMIPGTHRRIIEVDISNLKLKSDVPLDHIGWFQRGITPSCDYSKLPIPVPENRSNLSSFFYNDGWLDHIRGFCPEELYEARRPHRDHEIHGEILRKAAKRYIEDIQRKIQENVVFGALKDIGSTDE